MRKLMAAILLSVPVACTDRAEADYARCIQLDLAGDAGAAMAACSAAVAADPSTRSGKGAAARLADIQARGAGRSDAGGTVVTVVPPNSASAHVPPAAENDGSDATRPLLPPADDGFIDTLGGGGWGDRCFANIKSKRWGWAKAECDQAIAMNPAPPQPLASLLYNEGLIARQAGAPEQARHDFVASLALRDNGTVRAALQTLPASQAATAGGTCSQTLGATAAQQLVDQCTQVTTATHPPCNAQNSCDAIIDHIQYMCALVAIEGRVAHVAPPAFCRGYPEPPCVAACTSQFAHGSPDWFECRGKCK